MWSWGRFLLTIVQLLDTVYLAALFVPGGKKMCRLEKRKLRITSSRTAQCFCTTGLSGFQVQQLVPLNSLLTLDLHYLKVYYMNEAIKHSILPRTPYWNNNNNNNNNNNFLENEKTYFIKLFSN